MAGLRHVLLYFLDFQRAVSSAGRAPRLHRGGRRFETVTAHHPTCFEIGVPLGLQSFIN